MTDHTAERPPPEGASAPTFFGQPRALAYLAFTEAWERFSYYGMSALLALYLTQQLFLPGHVEHVVGFAVLRHTLEGVFGPMSTIALASQVYGLYSAFVYFTPVLGGIVADRWLGRRTAVILGAISMSAGHIAMAFDASFLPALLFLIVGSGLLKGNISTQVGELYAENDAEARTRGFAIFSIGINVGAVGGPLLCGLLAQVYGWHVGFGLAGALMLIGLATYVAGFRYLPKRAVVDGPAPEKIPLTRRDYGVIAALVLRGADHRLPVHRLLSELRRGPDLDRRQGGFELPRLPGADRLVQLHRPVGQHSRSAGADRPVALAGRARRRAGRHRQDRVGGVDRRPRQCAARGGLHHLAARAGDRAHPL